MSWFGSNITGKIFKVGKKYGLAFLVGFVFAILCFVGINTATEPASKSEFCGSTCHEMKAAYRNWELSIHGANKYGFRVECVDCHLPPKDEYFRHVATKAYEGSKDVFKHMVSSRLCPDVPSKDKAIAHSIARATRDDASSSNALAG